MLWQIQLQQLLSLTVVIISPVNLPYVSLQLALFEQMKNKCRAILSFVLIYDAVSANRCVGGLAFARALNLSPIEE